MVLDVRFPIHQRVRVHVSELGDKAGHLLDGDRVERAVDFENALRGVSDGRPHVVEKVLLVTRVGNRGGGSGTYTKTTFWCGHASWARGDYGARILLSRRGYPDFGQLVSPTQESAHSFLQLSMGDPC